MRKVCVVGASRTPIGSLAGSLAALSAPALGSIAIKDALAKAGVEAEQVQEVVMGNVVSANVGQAPARQAALGAGLPASAICTTLNKVCASGLKAAMVAAQGIMLGSCEVAVAGGMESMSNAPHYLHVRCPAAAAAAPQRRASAAMFRLGHGELTDALLRDGLWDPLRDVHMGECAERCAEKHGLGREAQDAHAAASYARAAAAQREGRFAAELCAVHAPPPRKGQPPVLVDADEEPSRGAAALPQLRPAFRKDGTGTVTAGNASSVNDGAAALVLMSAELAQRRGQRVLGNIVAFADAEQEPLDFPTTPTLAVQKLLAGAGMRVEDIDLFEINEAFSVVHLANQKLLGLDDAKVNVNGGAVALGHPIGCSGARILVTLLHALKNRGKRFGVAAICNGGGGASAMLVENPDAAPAS